MKMFFQVFSIILVISLLITGILFLLRRRFVKTEIALEHIHPSVFSFFTSLYAFFLGFAIVTLWSAYLNAESNVTREADSLLITFRISRNLPNSEGFRQALRDYVKSVAKDEWPAMESSSMSEKTQKHFDNVWDQLNLLKPKNPGDNDFYTAICNQLSEASRQRLSRALLVNGNLYPPIWVIIVFGFISVVYGLFFNHLQQNTIRVIFDFMVIFLVLSCIYFIYDIDTPFSGYIVVKPDIFTKIHERMLALQ